MEWYFSYICAGRLKKKWNLWSGSNRHSYFVVFCSVSVQALTRGQPFYGHSDKPPHFSRILRRAWGYGEPIVVVYPRVPREELQAMCERIVEQGPSPSLLKLVLFCFECFVCFVLCPCLKPKFQTKLVRLCI